MEINKAKVLVEDILDLCAQVGDEVLSEACAGIYNNIQSSKISIQEIIACAQEAMVFINETSWIGVEDLREEIEILYNQLLEEAEES